MNLGSIGIGFWNMGAYYSHVSLKRTMLKVCKLIFLQTILFNKGTYLETLPLL